MATKLVIATAHSNGVRRGLLSVLLPMRQTACSTIAATGTNGKGANRATLQDNGDFVLYTASNQSVWSTNTGGATPPAPTGNISHIGTTQVWDSDGQNLTIAKPANTQGGDLLVLVLHDGTIRQQTFTLDAARPQEDLSRSAGKINERCQDAPVAKIESLLQQDRALPAPAFDELEQQVLELVVRAMQQLGDVSLLPEALAQLSDPFPAVRATALLTAQVLGCDEAALVARALDDVVDDVVVEDVAAAEVVDA